MKKLVMLLVIFPVVAIAALLILDRVGEPGRTANLPRIVYTDIFDQEEDIYFVYFWRNDCPRCAEFEPSVVAAFNEGVPVYVVDMNNRTNSPVFYREGALRDDELPNQEMHGLSITDYSEIDVVGTPTVVRVENGVITDRVSGVPLAVALLDAFER